MRTRSAGAALAAIVALAALPGCDDEPAGPPAIRLFIDVEAAVPTEVDEVHVSIAASSVLTGERTVCTASTGLFNLPSPDVLPLYVRIEQGEIYTEAVMFTISGWLDDRQVLEEYKGTADWPAEGETDVEVSLSAGCLIDALDVPCEANQHCEAGGCRRSAAGFDDLLEHPEMIDDDPCWNEL